MIIITNTWSCQTSIAAEGYLVISACWRFCWNALISISPCFRSFLGAESAGRMSPFSFRCSYTDFNLCVEFKLRFRSRLNENLRLKMNNLCPPYQLCKKFSSKRSFSSFSRQLAINYDWKSAKTSFPWHCESMAFQAAQDIDLSRKAELCCCLIPWIYHKLKKFWRDHQTVLNIFSIVSDSKTRNMPLYVIEETIAVIFYNQKGQKPDLKNQKLF